MTDVPWEQVWADVAARIARHRAEGRGHLLTEDAVRFETVLSLEAHGVPSSWVAFEVVVPELRGGKLDLVVDPPTGSVVELKYPRGSRTGISPDTMTLGELLRDVFRVAAVPAQDRWVVHVLEPRLLRYLRGVGERHPLAWATSPGERLRLEPSMIAGLPPTALQAIGGAALTEPVEATCVLAERIDGGLSLFAYRVEGAAVALAAVPEVLVSSDRVGAGTREGARLEILAAARRVMTHTGQDTFTVPAVVEDMHAHGTGCADATIRTMLTSHLCAQAVGDGVAGHADVERVGRGTYRLV